jgi:hypothetical protein
MSNFWINAIIYYIFSTHYPEQYGSDEEFEQAMDQFNEISTPIIAAAQDRSNFFSGMLSLTTATKQMSLGSQVAPELSTPQNGPPPIPPEFRTKQTALPVPPKPTTRQSPPPIPKEDPE